MNNELAVSDLKKQFDVKKLGIESTEKLEKLKGIIGQERAVQALRFGLNINGGGFNVYVAGPPGIGKMTSVESFIERVASEKDTPPDWCYVNNFEDPYNPKAIELPTGQACTFEKDMENLIERVRNDLPKAFEGDEYTSHREEIVGDLEKKREKLSREINEKANKEGFSIQPSPMGIMLVPMKDGKPMSDEQLQSLPESERNDIYERRDKLQGEIKSAMKDIRKLENELQGRFKDLDHQVAMHTIGGQIEDLIEKYQEYPKIVQYLKEVQNDIVDNIDTFKINPEQQGAKMQPQAKAQMQTAKEISFRKYQVNVLVDNCKQEGAPVIVEHNPTYNNLLGRIEKEMQMGALSTDFTMIKAGSLTRANGGFLVIPIEDLLLSFYSYEALKRTLRSREIQIEELGERLGFMAVKSVRPEPIPVDVKVVLIGSPLIYLLLNAYDEDFSELFKVKADFDTQMDAEENNISDFMAFISTYCEKEKLRHLDQDATVKLMEYALRLAGDKEKLSTKFGLLSDMIREANYWAKIDNGKYVGSKHIQKTIDEKIFRSSLMKDRIQEMIERGTLLIATDGKTVGQVNGLSIIHLGDYMFGHPSRITATVNAGREGILDIEREVKLGGPIHSKGVQIMSGYLANKYANGNPVTLEARLVFEQSYRGVEGDSASAAELFSIVSALSGVPINQGIAVTGSMNQHGEIQAIGGVNQKIEGFFDVCKEKGLTGNQGVIIPQSNVKNLMLWDDVIKAVEEKQFHIWAVKNIDEGIEILTGVKSGEKQHDGIFPEDTVNYKVQKRLQDYSERIRSLGSSNN